jgi:two-component system phosphate regulon sensor histidine kinase PhoR
VSNLRLRVTLIYGLLLLVSLAALTLLVRSQMDAEYRDLLRNRLTAEARFVASEAAQRLDTGAELQEWAGGAGEATGTRVTIILPDGRVVADSEEDPARMENHAGRPEVQQALGGGEGAVGSAQRHSATLDRDLYYVAVPLPANGGAARGVARLAVPVANIEASLQGLTATLLGTVLLVGVFTLLASFLFTRITLRPLVQLAVLASRLGKGDLDARLPVDAGARDEMSQLARTFNEMAARLAGAIGRLIVQRDDMNAVLQQMAEGLIMTDEQGHIVQMNRAAGALLDTREEQAVGKPFIQVVRDHELNARLHAALASDGKSTTTHEVSYGPRLLQVTLAAVPHAGRRNGLAVMHDVTQLRQLERARRDFVANISHELRTPLASIKLLVETLETAVEEDPAEARDFLRRIDTEVDGLTQLVRELLELSRIESGQVELTLAPVEPQELLEAAAKRLTPLAERAGISVRVEAANDLPECLADRDRVEQVLLNLLHNAIKYTAPGGEVTLSAGRCERPPDMLQFAVADTGAGIPADDLPRIFERFYKVDKARTGMRSGGRSIEGGTGLGLAIAKHIVQAHGGSIWAESVEGKGSTFYFTLPVAGSDLAAAPAAVTEGESNG